MTITAIPIETNVTKYHMDVLSQHSVNLYSTLLQPHHIISDNLKEIEFDGDQDDTGRQRAKRGYFARKEKQKYWIKELDFPKLPLRIVEHDELKHKDDVILNPTRATTFNITPENKIPVRMLIDDFCPFEHTEPDYWTLAKLVAIASYVGKTFICIASEPSFGKTSVFNVLHSITDKSPVFKPRSVPGVLNKINTTGSMVFDEAHESSKDTRDIMEEFTLNIGGGSTIYINGAMKSHATKNKYDCRLQSIAFLYNNVGCYKDPEKKYFEVIFSNNKAMDNRLLKFKFKGELRQVFSRDFDIQSTAKEHKMYYINIAKTLLWLQEHKLTGEYQRQFKTKCLVPLKGRKKIVYNEITWLLDMYCADQKEYDKFIRIMDTAITDYAEMISVLNDSLVCDVETEEVIE